MTEKENLPLFTDYVYSVYDIKAGTYGNPFLASTDDEAKRIFTDIVCNSGDNLISKHKEDYSIYRLGVFNRRSGLLNSQGVPSLLVSALDVYNSYVTILRRQSSSSEPSKVDELESLVDV